MDCVGGPPPLPVLLIFVLGTLLMRSAGCAINDYADRDFDRHVKRTENRPVTSGKIAAWEAVALAAGLSVLAFLLILPLNALTKELSVAALFVAGSYPFTKRFFAIPQAWLGVAFGFGIPMAFAAVQDQVPVLAWVMLVANVFWSIAYDTEYAMVDRDDDIKIGIRTSALTFGRFDVLAVMLVLRGDAFRLRVDRRRARVRDGVLARLGRAAGCAIYHFMLIRHRERMACFKAFRHNNWLAACCSPASPCITRCGNGLSRSHCRPNSSPISLARASAASTPRTIASLTAVRCERSQRGSRRTAFDVTRSRNTPGGSSDCAAICAAPANVATASARACASFMPSWRAPSCKASIR